jgi:hypothetical protein
MYQKLLGSATVMCTGGAPLNSPARTKMDSKERARRQRKVKEQAARSKSGMWGPTHSFDSDEVSSKSKQRQQPSSVAGMSGWFSKTAPKASSSSTTPPKPPSQLNRSQGTDSTKSSHSFSGDASPALSPDAPPQASYMGRVWKDLQCQHDTTTATTPKDKQFLDYVEDVCSPCQPKNLDASFTNDIVDPPLGICRMEPPMICSGSSNASQLSKQASTETPADRRRQRHERRQQQRSTAPSPQENEAYEVTESKILEPHAHTVEKVPLESLTLDKETAVELERSISELTMRSSYGQATAKLADHRRMAYYAVGRHHRQSGRGGNRRCYFTGKLILGGAPFYAGSVQQGLRTLVVFCLPSSLGLPKEAVGRDGSVKSVLQSLGDSTHHTSRRGLVRDQISQNSIGNTNSRKGPSILSRKGSRLSRLSSMDDMSLSVEEELDPNWGLDREYLLRVLPEPKQPLLDEMASRFPAQFETLPVQVRSPHCWRLFVKFCFFSGLPIAEGELHYKVRDEVADLYGEEVILSHEVMEAVNGDSAEILRLPNLKTFRYLRKHYNQQSAKLPNPVFERCSWDMVRPEV